MKSVRDILKGLVDPLYHQDGTPCIDCEDCNKGKKNAITDIKRLIIEKLPKIDEKRQTEGDMDLGVKIGTNFTINQMQKIVEEL